MWELWDLNLIIAVFVLSPIVLSALRVAVEPQKVKGSHKKVHKQGYCRSCNTTVYTELPRFYKRFAFIGILFGGLGLCAYCCYYLTKLRECSNCRTTVSTSGDKVAYIESSQDIRDRERGKDLKPKYANFCVVCKRHVQNVRKPFNVAVSLLSLLFFGYGFIVYLIYHLIKPKDRCGICKLELPRSMKEILQAASIDEQAN